MQLKIDNIRLEPLAEKHVSTLFSLTDQNREYLREWLPWVDGNTEEQHTRNFVIKMQGLLQEGKGRGWAVYYEDQLVGVIDFHRMKLEDGITDIGYFLGKNSQGKGIVTRACQAIIDFGRTELDLKKITIRCISENVKSQAIPKRLGFTKVRTDEKAVLLYGKKRDLVIFELELS